MEGCNTKEGVRKALVRYCTSANIDELRNFLSGKLKFTEEDYRTGLYSLIAESRTYSDGLECIDFLIG